MSGREPCGQDARAPRLGGVEVPNAAAVRNVILIISDTLRLDCVGAYGPPPWFSDRAATFTPRLDAFAARSVVFERAFSSSFPTVPLRNDLLTGRATFTYKPWAP